MFSSLDWIIDLLRQSMFWCKRGFGEAYLTDKEMEICIWSIIRSTNTSTTINTDGDIGDGDGDDGEDDDDDDKWWWWWLSLDLG